MSSCFKFQYVSLIFFMINYTKCKPFNRDLRLSLADSTNYNLHEPNGPGSYAFGYDLSSPDDPVDDNANNNLQFRGEERYPNGTVTGSYGWMAPNGIIFKVSYIADENGYRAKVENLGNGMWLKRYRRN